MKTSDILTRALQFLPYVFFPVLLFLSPLSASLPMDEAFKVPQETFAVIGCWLFAASVLLGRAAAGKPWIPAVKLSWVAIALAVEVLLCPRWAFNGPTAGGYVLTVVAYALMGITLWSWLSEAPERRTYAFATLGALVGMECVFAWMEGLTVPFESWAAATPVLPLLGNWARDFLMLVGAGSRLHLAFGTFGNVNYLAEFLVLTTPPLVAAAFAREKRWLAAAVALAALVTVVITGARAAMIGLVVALPLGALAAFGDPRVWLGRMKKSTLVSGALVVLGILAVGGHHLFLKLTHASVNDPDTASRLYNWQGALHIWSQHPLFGAGLGGFKILDVEALRALYPHGVPPVAIGARFIETHCEPLQILSELGLVGFLLAAACVVQWLRTVARNPFYAPIERLGFYTGLGALIIAGSFAFPLHVADTALALTVVFALGLVTQEPDPEPFAPAWRPLYALATVAIVAFSGYQALSRGVLPLFAAYHETNQAETLINNRQYGQAETVLAQADRDSRFRGRVRWIELKLLVLEGKYTDAIALYQASTHEGLGADADYWVGRSYQLSGHPDQAVEWFKRVDTYYAGQSGGIPAMAREHLQEILASSHTAAASATPKAKL